MSSSGDHVVDSYVERKRRNDESKAWASRDGEPWSADEEEFLLHEWIDVHPSRRDERVISQCLERTIEACRVRCEIIRARHGITTREVIVTYTEHVTRYIGAHDDTDDQWWSPDYYK